MVKSLRDEFVRLLPLLRVSVDAVNAHPERIPSFELHSINFSVLIEAVETRDRSRGLNPDSLNETLFYKLKLLSYVLVELALEIILDRVQLTIDFSKQSLFNSLVLRHVHVAQQVGGRSLDGLAASEEDGQQFINALLNIVLVEVARKENGQEVLHIFSRVFNSVLNDLSTSSTEVCFVSVSPSVKSSHRYIDEVVVNESFSLFADQNDVTKHGLYVLSKVKVRHGPIFILVRDHSSRDARTAGYVDDDSTLKLQRELLKVNFINTVSCSELLKAGLLDDLTNALQCIP